MRVLIEVPFFRHSAVPTNPPISSGQHRRPGFANSGAGGWIYPPGNGYVIGSHGQPEVSQHTLHPGSDIDRDPDAHNPYGRGGRDQDGVVILSVFEQVRRIGRAIGVGRIERGLPVRLERRH